MHRLKPPSAQREQPSPWISALGPRLTAVLTLAVFLIAAPAQGYEVDDYPSGSSIPWLDFEPALFTRARTENRPLFFYFHGQWCTWCRDFQNESLEDPAVVTALQRGFLPVLIDLDRRRDLFTRYGGRGLPFVVITDYRDDIRARFTGHIGPQDLARVLAEHRPQVSVTGREQTPADDPIHDVAGFLDMLDQVYDPATRRLTGSALFGTLSKRPQPWTLALLLRQDEWRARVIDLLDQIADDLADPVDGGFFFFHDPDQPDPGRARETSKRLDQNAAFLWLFADAYATFGETRHRILVERSLNYLRDHLWDQDNSLFFSSQYSDPFYYSRPGPERERLPPPPVDRTTVADMSGQAIAALVMAACALEEPSLLVWARDALFGIERSLRDGDGYFHALPAGGPPELAGYLPALVWPGIAWHLFGMATGEPLPARERELLAAVKAHYDPGLGGYRERRTREIDPWVETRTQAALAWWLSGLPGTLPEEAGVDPAAVHPHLRLNPGDDPDDAALGFWKRGDAAGAQVQACGLLPSNGH